MLRQKAKFYGIQFGNPAILRGFLLPPHIKINFARYPFQQLINYILKKATLIIALFLTGKSYAQLYHEDLQLGLSVGTVFGTSGVGIQAMSELKIAQYFSLSYRALTSDAAIITGLGHGSKSYREQALLFGFHVPVSPFKHQIFFKVGPGYFVQKSTSGTLLNSESSSINGQATAFEAGFSYEHKAMDLQLGVAYSTSHLSSQMPLSMGVKLGVDPLYWILPNKSKTSEL